jgi:hypothetical protein
MCALNKSSTSPARREGLSYVNPKKFYGSTCAVKAPYRPKKYEHSRLVNYILKMLSNLVLFQTTIALSDQFQAALSTNPSPVHSPSEGSTKKQDPLPLLATSSTILKSQVTKLSLLTITPPFTDSAIATVLTAVNDSVLPSLVTASLLLGPETHTSTYVKEVKSLTRTVLREFGLLVQEVKSVADKQHQHKYKEQISQSEKEVLTSATGRVWDACDALINLANNGVVGFIIQKVQQWRSLVQDAIEELGAWDPDADDDEDETFDVAIEGKDSEEESSNSALRVNKDDAKMRTAVSEVQRSFLRILKPVSTIYPAIISHRLKKGGLLPPSSPSTAYRIPPPAYIPKLESLAADLRQIPDDVDEAAGLLYEWKIAQTITYIGKIRETATRAISSVRYAWGASERDEQEEDKFMIFAKTWLKVAEDMMKAIDRSSGE